EMTGRKFAPEEPRGECLDALPESLRRAGRLGLRRDHRRSAAGADRRGVTKASLGKRRDNNRTHQALEPHTRATECERSETRSARFRISARKAKGRPELFAVTFSGQSIVRANGARNFATSYQHDVVLLLRIERLDLQRDRLADEVAELRQPLRFLVEE